MYNTTIGNALLSGRVVTPPPIAQQIYDCLLVLPDGDVHIVDTSVGTGNLLFPVRNDPRAKLLGIEISADAVAEARDTIPTATVIHAACENVRITPGSINLVVHNPPYMNGEDERLELTFMKYATKILDVGGIQVVIVPARQWNYAMAKHFWRWYDQVRAWMFPQAEFEKYTQIVVAGIRRGVPRQNDEAEALSDLERIKGFQWLGPDSKDPDDVDLCWRGKHALPVLPATPFADAYHVPLARSKAQPDIVIMKADEAAILHALETGGAHLSPAWTAATTWTPEFSIDRPLMPISGNAHLAALILVGACNYRPVQGPDGKWYAFGTYVTTKMVSVKPTEEQLQKRVIHVEQQQDHAIMRVLSLETGKTATYQGDEVHTFLAPWLPLLAGDVLREYQPLYQLDPEDWEIDVVTRIGLDKQLPNSERAGLAPQQMHRVFAMWRAACEDGRVAIQGEPGTGKTRMHIALLALFAFMWQHRTTYFHGRKLPRWVKGIRRAWKANPRTVGDAPSALPLMVVTPMRVVGVWEQEIDVAWEQHYIEMWRDNLALMWPDAEYMVVETHQDVARWMRRCAETTAPAVIAIWSQSKTRAFGRVSTEPAVIEKARILKVPDLEAEGERVMSGDTLIGIEDADGQIITKYITQKHFFCPGCGVRIEAVPGSALRKSRYKKDTDEGASDTLEPVTDREWFSQKQRTCDRCATQLWTSYRIKAHQTRYPQLPFAIWDQAAPQLVGHEPTIERRAGRASALVRLALSSEGGTIPVEVPDLDPPDRSKVTPLRNPKQEIVGYIDPVSGRLMTKPASCSFTSQAPDSFSPFEYLHRFYKGCVAFVEVDESHNARNKTTDIGHAIHLAQISAQCYGYGSGTHYGGILTDFFSYWFRFNPRFWLKLGLGWHDAEQAMSMYGVIQTITREHESEARRGSGRTDVTITQIPAPGISARLLPHLLSQLIFIDVLDVGAYMPPRVEIPVVVDMAQPELYDRWHAAKAALKAAEHAVSTAEQARDALLVDETSLGDELHAAQQVFESAKTQREAAKQEVEAAHAWALARDLAQAYRQVEGKLEKLSKDRVSAATLQKGTLPGLWAILPFSDEHFEVSRTDRGDWGTVEGVHSIFKAPQLASDHLYPLERELQQIVAKELAEERPVMVYFAQNQRRSTAVRLASYVLQEVHPWTLPNNVDPEDREVAINGAIADGHKVLLIPYERVLEGLNLQAAKTIIWYEMAKNLFYLDQASRRSWRLGQDTEVRLYYMAYAGTTAHRKLVNLGTKSGAADLFAGNTPDSKLAQFAGADQTTLAKLSHGISTTDGDLVEAFKRRSDELAAKLCAGRRFMGVEDRLPERLAARYARPQVVQIEDAATAEDVAATVIEVSAERAVEEIACPVAAVHADHQPVAKRRRMASSMRGVATQLSLDSAQPEPTNGDREPASTSGIVFGDTTLLGSELRRSRKDRRSRVAGQLSLSV